MKLSQKEAVFTSEVATRFELYNSLFLTLPFYKIKDKHLTLFNSMNLMLNSLHQAVLLTALLAFMWSLGSGQYEDLDGAAERILHQEGDAPPD